MQGLTNMKTLWLIWATLNMSMVGNRKLSSPKHRLIKEKKNKHTTGVIAIRSTIIKKVREHTYFIKCKPTSNSGILWLTFNELRPLFVIRFDWMQDRFQIEIQVKKLFTVHNTRCIITVLNSSPAQSLNISIPFQWVRKFKWVCNS